MMTNFVDNVFMSDDAHFILNCTNDLQFWCAVSMRNVIESYEHDKAIVHTARASIVTVPTVL